jgi:hypothetical protein
MVGEKVTDEEAIESLLQPVQGLEPGDGRMIDIDITPEQLERLKPQLRERGYDLVALQ